MSEVTTAVRAPGVAGIYGQAPRPAFQPIATPVGGRRLRPAIAAGLTMILAALGGVSLTAMPAHAATTTTFAVQHGGAWARGKLTWHNRSVQVGGGVGATSDSCLAVVFTAYDKNNKVVAREARPGDGVYNCNELRSYRYGFVLDADTVYGGIRWISVDLWARDTGNGTKQLIDHADYWRR